MGAKTNVRTNKNDLTEFMAASLYLFSRTGLRSILYFGFKSPPNMNMQPRTRLNMSMSNIADETVSEQRFRCHRVSVAKEVGSGRKLISGCQTSQRKLDDNSRSIR